MGNAQSVKKKMWFNENCKKALEIRDKARLKVIQNPSNENKRTLASKQREAKRTIRMAKRLWEKQRITEIENNNNKNNIKAFFEKVKNVKTGYRPKTSMIRIDDGTIITDKGKIANEFKRIFEEMLNQQENRTTIEVNVTAEELLDKPTIQEIKMGLEMLKNGKAPGIDEVVPECLIKGGKKLTQRLHNLITDIWEQEEISESWKMSILCPIYKKGDKMDPKNYRGISLLNTSYKVLSNLLLNRLKPFIKEVIGEYQAGFMEGKSTIDQIHIIKQVAEKSHEFNKDVHMLFVDFKAAYDSIDRNKLWNVMSRIGIPEKLIRMIKTCVQGSKCKVNFGGDYSNEFLVSTGLRQGDALSPALFNIALESVVRQVLSKAKGIKISDNQQLAIVAYADDLVITTENEEV